MDEKDFAGTEKLIASDGVGDTSKRQVARHQHVRVTPELFGRNHEFEQGQYCGADLSSATVRDEIHTGRNVASAQAIAGIPV